MTRTHQASQPSSALTPTQSNDLVNRGYVDSAIAGVSAAPTPYRQLVGDGTSGPFTITHNLGTRDVGVDVFAYGPAGTWENVLVRYDRATANTIILRPDEVWATNGYRIVVRFLDQSDVTAPSAPAITFTSKDSTSITVSMSTAATDTQSGVYGYIWYLDSVAQTATPQPLSIGAGVTFSGLANSSTHTISLVGVDFEGNVSAQSNVITQTTNSGADVTAPTAGTATFSSATYTTITYTFTAGSDNVGVDHINAYDADGTTLLASNVTSPFVRGSTTGANGPLTINTSYGTLFRYFDAAGNHSDSGTVTHSTNADVTAPTAGSASLNTFDTTSITYNFTAGSDDVAVVGVDAYTSTGTLLASNVTSPWARTSLTQNTSYATKFRYRDAAGNFADSNTVTQTTATASDTTPPTAGSASFSSSTTTTLTYTFTAGSDNVGVTQVDAYDGTSNTLIAATVTSPFVRGSGTGANAALTSATSYVTFFRYRDAAGNFSDSNAVTHSTDSAVSPNVAFGAVGTGSRNISSPTNATDSLVVPGSLVGGYLIGVGWLSHSANNADINTWDSLTVTDSAGDTWAQVAGITNGQFTASQFGSLVVLAKVGPTAATHNTTFTPVKSALGTISAISWVTAYYTGYGSLTVSFSTHPTSGTSINQSPVLSAGSVALNLVISSATISSLSPAARYFGGSSVTGTGDYSIYQDAAAPGGGGAVSFTGTNSNTIGQLILELKKAP